MPDDCLGDLYRDRDRLEQLITRRYPRSMPVPELLDHLARVHQARRTSTSTLLLTDVIYGAPGAPGTGRGIDDELGDAISLGDPERVRRLESRIVRAELGDQIGDLYQQVEYGLERARSLETALERELLRRIIEQDGVRLTVQAPALGSTGS